MFIINIVIINIAIIVIVAVGTVIAESPFVMFLGLPHPRPAVHEALLLLLCTTDGL